MSFPNINRGRSEDEQKVHRIVLGKNVNPQTDSERRLFARVKSFVRRHTPKDKTSKLCFICNDNFHITENHHLIAVEDIAHIILRSYRENVRLGQVIIPTVWLCPNHHTIWHKIDDDVSAELAEASSLGIIGDVHFLVTAFASKYGINEPVYAEAYLHLFRIKVYERVGYKLEVPDNVLITYLEIPEAIYEV